MNLTTNSTRDQILMILKTDGPQTVDMLSRKLGITPMGARQHLTILEGDALVHVTRERRGVGRPAFLYHLTEGGRERFPRNYDGLAKELLDALATLDGDEKVNELLRFRWKQFAAQHGPALANKSLPERVAELARIQNEKGYLAGWENGEDALYLYEHNCAIARVACEYGQTCKYELETFQRLLGVPIERVECLSDGGSSCVYRIPKRAEAAATVAGAPSKARRR